MIYHGEVTVPEDVRVVFRPNWNELMMCFALTQLLTQLNFSHRVESNRRAAFLGLDFWLLTTIKLNKIYMREKGSFKIHKMYENNCTNPL